MIQIDYVYATNVIINYENKEEEHTVGTLGYIADHVCEILVKKNYKWADVMDEETGEILIILNRE